MSTGAAPGLALDLAVVAKSRGTPVRLFVKADNELIERILSVLKAEEVKVIDRKKSYFFVMLNILSGGRLVFRKISKFLIPCEPVVIPMPGILEYWIPKKVSEVHEIFTVMHDPYRHKGDFLPRDFMIKHLYRTSKNLIYFSHFTFDRLNEKYGHRDVPQHITAHPIPSLASRSKTPQTSSVNYVLLIGRNKRYQNFKEVAAFWCTISSKVSNLNLIIAGQNTSSFANVRHRIRVENRWLSELEFGRLVALSSGILLPYSEASQSGPASLAIGLGKHVIYSRVGGLPEQLSTYELGLPFTNEIELLESLEVINSSPELEADPCRNWEETWFSLVEFIKGVR
jgi:hypothetical protein